MVERQTAKRLVAQARRLKRAQAKSNQNQVRKMQRLLKEREQQSWLEVES